MQSVLRHRNQVISVELQREGEETFLVTLDGEKQHVHAELIDANTLRLVVAGISRLVRIVRSGKDHHVAIGGRTFAITPEAAGAANTSTATLANPQIIAPMPGKVLQVLVKEGQAVAEGDGLLILEAMKMENRVVAEAPGTVKKVNVVEGQMVDGGLLMMELEY